MDTIVDKGMVSLPIKDYDRFKELEKKDYDFEKRVSIERDSYNDELQKYKDKHTICLLKEYPWFGGDCYTLVFENPDAEKWIMDKIGFKKFEKTCNGVNIDGQSYLKATHLLCSLNDEIFTLEREIDNLKQKRQNILSSLSLFSLIKSWWNTLKINKI